MRYILRKILGLDKIDEMMLRLFDMSMALAKKVHNDDAEAFANDVKQTIELLEFAARAQQYLVVNEINKTSDSDRLDKLVELKQSNTLILNALQEQIKNNVNSNS